MIHHLKILPPYFKAVAQQKKTFEARKNDRDYKVGDVLILEEWAPGTGYTGQMCARFVTYILYGGEFGIDKGYCVMALSDGLQEAQEDGTHME